MEGLRHAAYLLRVSDSGPGAWSLSFDAASQQRTGSWYSEWGWCLKGRHFELSGHGPVVSDHGGNVSAEWEGLVAGLDFLARGKLGGLQALAITGDQKTVIGQLNGRQLCRLDIHASWCSMGLDLLALIGRPWSAVKVSRAENAAADAVAGGERC